ncbi:hypothetical protein ACJZ2D_008418 [Fusarium nematophilum]
MTLPTASIQSRTRGAEGIPIGFITRLEARLAETEEALFRVIDSTRDANDTRVAFKPASQRKADRIKEWDTFPLRSMDDIKLWFQNKSGVDNSGAGTSRVEQLDLSRGNLATQRTVPAMEFPVPIVDLGSAERATPPLLEANGDSLLEDSWEATAESGRSKAKALEQKHPNMYF